MKKVIPITEQFQHFLEETKENFFGAMYRRTRLAWEQFLQSVSLQERNRYLGVRAGGRQAGASRTAAPGEAERASDLPGPRPIEAEQAFRVFRAHWQSNYPVIVKRLEQDLLELLAFFSLPPHLWRKLRTTNVMERRFVEVRRRTRPRVCFVNEASVERIIFSIFTASTKTGGIAPSAFSHTQLDITLTR